jgi:hypothetical protein
LLQKNRVVSFEGLEDVVVAAQLAEAIHSSVAVTPAALAADV